MKNLVNKYRNKGLYSFNCAETMVYSANEYYQLELSEDALKMAAGFGGGMFEKHLCGIVSGAICVLGIMFKNKTLNDSNLLEITVNEFKEEFRKKYDKLECNYLLDNYYSEEQGCNDMIVNAAEMLEFIIDKYQIN